MKNKKIKKLVLGDFKRKGELGSFNHYFSHILKDGKEICLEACLNGYDVAIYDKEDGDLFIGKKECTDLKGLLKSQIIPGFSIMTGSAIDKALKIANKLIKKHENT